MIVFVVVGLTVFVLATLAVIGSIAFFIVAVSLLPIFGMFGVALYEGVETLRERPSPEPRTQARTRPVTGSVGRPVPHH
jgi:hypothetical protein